MSEPRRSHFQTGNFERNNRNKSGRKTDKLQMKHIFFGFMGGFYFSDYFKPWMKYAWILANISYIVIGLTQFLLYPIVMQNKPAGDLFFAFFMINTGIIVAFFVPLFTYYFKNEYKLVLNLNEDKLDNEMVDFYENVIRFRNQLIFLSSNQFIVGQLYSLIHLIPLFLIDERKYLRDIQYYTLPNLWLGKIHTRIQYFYLWCLQYLFTIYASLILTSFTSTFMVTAYEFYLASVILCSRMEKFSKNARKRFSQLNTAYLWICENAPAPNEHFSYTKQTKILRQELSSHMVDAIKDFQKLINKLHMIKQFIEFAFTMFVTLGFLNQCFFVYIICSQELETFLKIKAIVTFVFAETLLFGLCITGKTFDDMREMIMNQVQDIPWYYMDRSQNKILFIFIYLTQKSISFHALKMFLMGMNIFLQSAKFTYTFYNVLRAALET